MSRRSPSALEVLIQLPWWVSTGIGVGAAIATEVMRRHLAAGGSFNTALAAGLWWTPWAIASGFALVAALSVLVRRRNAQIVEEQTSLKTLRQLHWHDLERLVGEAYRRRGYTVEQPLTPGGADGGIDLILRREGRTTLVQCKQWRSGSVGITVVREIFGVMMHERADAALVITSGKFTREAQDFALGKPLELIDGPALLALVREVQAGPAQPVTPPAAAHAVLCPECGASMVLRTAKRGLRSGEQFWGCSRYPVCRGKLNFSGAK